MPALTGNKMRLTIQQALGTDGTVQDCLATQPTQLVISRGQFQTIELHANQTNSRDITITFSDPQAAVLFNPPPPQTITLAPNSDFTLNIRSGLVINAAQPPTVKFVTNPAQRCGSGDLADVVVES